MLTDSFSLIRVLNLRDRPDRLREVIAQLSALGLSFAPGKVELFAADRPTDPGGFRNLGSRGCFLSHLSMLRDALERRVESVLILEDDCEVLPRDASCLSDLAAQLAQQPWGFAYLGHMEPAQPATVRPTLIQFDGPLRSTHCYAVHRSALAPLVAYLEACLTRPPGDPIGGPMDVDGAISMFRAANPQFVTLLANPSLAGQRSSRSDITFHRWELIPGVKQGLGWGRRVKRMLKRLMA